MQLKIQQRIRKQQELLTFEVANDTVYEIVVDGETASYTSDADAATNEVFHGIKDAIEATSAAVVITDNGSYELIVTSSVAGDEGAVEVELVSNVTKSVTYVPTEAWSVWSTATTANIEYTDTAATQYMVVKDNIVYVDQYKEIYHDLHEQATTAISDGKNTILEKLFTEIDTARANDDITVIEQLSMKKNAYLQLLTAVTTQSQKTAISLVDKRHKFDGELSQQNLQITMQEKQLEGADADKDYKVASKIALEDQVRHNRQIKTLGHISNVNGMSLGGGTAVNSTQLDQFNKLVYVLAPEIV